MTLKNPLISKFVLLGAGQPVGVHPVNVFGSRIPLVVPNCKTNGEVFVGVVPVQARKLPEAGKGLFGPVIAERLPGKDAEEVAYVNLSKSELLLIPDVLGETLELEVATGDGEPKAASKEGLRVPDDWMRVVVGLKGIKSIYKTALDGAASKRIAVAMPATPKSE